MTASPYAALLRQQAYIDGRWLDGAETFAVTNPATGARIAQVPDLGAADTQAAIAAAEAALPAWRALPAKQRSAVLRRWYDLILANADGLAALMTAEQGKPLAEAKGEVGYGASFVEWFAEEAKRVYGDTIPAPSGDKRLLTIKQPIGVVAAITPWNFPVAMITRKVAPALAAGCTVVLKPSDETPLCALALTALAEQAGLPAGVLNVITSRQAAAVGQVLTDSPVVRKLTFTGSTGVGKRLMAQCAGTVKKLSLELGGNAPFIVFDDADLDLAIQGILLAKFRNAGQTCICANRLLVQEGILPEFARRLADAMAAFNVADGASGNSQIGPLINAAAVSKVQSLVDDALAAGAQCQFRHPQLPEAGHFSAPTLLTGVTPLMRIAKEEIFGPVASILAFKDEAEAIALANDTQSGLAAYLYTRDLGRLFRVAEALEYGMVGINDSAISNEVGPFGGVKESGLGREGSKYGIDEFLEVKYLCLGGL